MNREEITTVIQNSISEFEKSFSIKIEQDTALYGDSGSLDSLGLVQFLAILEQNLEEKTGGIVTIASEKAVSQKNSPFRSIATLQEYIIDILSEGNNE
ncbi:MAG TPA: acyl carrier protein [Patescibacteria group bacterium]|nr:acyl carrier protein [Patescibacteria group bacterium]